jgi:acyl-CoA dehydrogenase
LRETTDSPQTSMTPVPDSHGIDRFVDDSSLAALLPLYVEEELLAHLRPVLEDLGPRLGGELDDLAHEADINPPVLEHRTRNGADRQSIKVHPAYRRLQGVAFGELGMAAMSHRPGVLGWPEPLPPVAKYLFFYLFAQAEFGLECPVSMTDALTRTLRKYGSDELVERYLDGLTSTDLDSLTQGAMFMTEQDAGSDVGRATTTAVDKGDGTWSLTGEKWFCSNADAELSMVLARPEGAKRGIKGIGLFLLPRTLPDGTANSMRIVRLKDKLGTRSMPSGEISLNEATAYLVGDVGQGFVQMADMINSSRLSNGVRSAGLMRRAFGESKFICRNREAFGTTLAKLPLQRRQLAKIMVTTEQALSMSLHTSSVFARADAGDAEAASVLRILTPLIKFRSTRDARKVTADAMEIRGGVGYIEEFGDARTFRDAQLGSIWEGTSNIVALDVIRAAHRSGALKPLFLHLETLLAEATDLPDAFRKQAATLSSELMHGIESTPEGQDQARVRQLGTAAYNLVSAVIMAWEGAQIGNKQSDWSRIVTASLVLRHKLMPQNPLVPVVEDETVLDALINDEGMDRDRAFAAVADVLSGGAE